MSNFVDHVRELTNASAAMQSAIRVAGEELPREDLQSALAGVELVSNLAAEFAMLVPE